MRTLLKVIGVVLAVLVLAGVALVAYVQFTYDRDFSAVPLPAIHATADSAILARGEYLVTAVAHCSACHAITGTGTEAGADPRGPLTGGFVFDIPAFGKFVPANLTPDSATGIGAMSDGQLARAIRNGVGRHGQLLPFMNFSVGNMSDADLTAIISWLRTRPPVTQQNQAGEWGPAAKALSLVLRPREQPPMADVAPHVVGPERGRYLANGPAACVGCHTPANPLTFALEGAPFSGNATATPDESDAAWEFVTPNLTPDSATGHIVAWTEEQFLARFRQGRVYRGSIMPWDNFALMTERDIRSLYQYLSGLEPVANAVGPSRRRIGGVAAP